MMTNTAPGMTRGFVSENFFEIPQVLWKEARDEAFSMQNLSVKFEAYASDTDKTCIDITRNNIKRAKMEKFVNSFVKDALSIETNGRRGTIVCNPPYGERIFSKEQTKILYKSMGTHFKKLDLWQIYILSALEEFPVLYGKKPDKVRNFYNGMIKCGYFQYFKSGKI